MRKLSFFILVLIFLLSCGSSILAESQSLPESVDYQIGNYVPAESVKDFDGLWVSEYVFVPSMNTTFVYSAYSPEPMLVDCFDGICYVFSSGSFEIDNTLEFQEGKLISESSNATGELYLLDDGTLDMHIVTSEAQSLDIIFAKQEPKYEELSYRSLARKPESYFGSFAVFTGSLVQVAGSRNAGEIYEGRLAIDENSDQVIYVVFENKPDYNLLEDDNITVYVRLAGEYTYNALLGNSVTVPIAFAHQIDLNE